MEEVWKAALVRVLRDLVSTGVSAWSARRDAERWVGDFPSRDFREVCENAGVNSQKAHRVLQQICRTEISLRPALLDVLDTREVGAERVSHIEDGRRAVA